MTPTESYIQDFYLRFQEGYPHLSDEQAEEIKSWLKSITEEVRGEAIREGALGFQEWKIKKERNRILNLPIMQEEKLPKGTDGSLVAETMLPLVCAKIQGRNSLRKEILKQVNNS